MPTPVLKSLASKANKSMKAAEEAWEDAKLEADAKFGGKEKDDYYWAYVTMVTKRKLGIEDDWTD